MGTTAWPRLRQLVTCIFKTLLPSNILLGPSAETWKCAVGECRRLDSDLRQDNLFVDLLSLTGTGVFAGQPRSQRPCGGAVRTLGRGGVGSRGRPPGLHVRLLSLPSTLVVRRPLACADRVSPASAENADSPTCSQKQVGAPRIPEGWGFFILKRKASF